ncbi:nuclear transport factor 2 family protein [Haloferax larsenii]|uniref:Ketosteroid isomerase-related protein n=1 Tax=Haloferax larsenii TaxID=302484 RepID=A0A1H7SZZ6_HALLR|nr:nuclear transport factor 2 family protein [Haloferax larsenii]SEL77865.1 Ketosteroid isomerase-related protein [Haloferax larsenii]
MTTRNEDFSREDIDRIFEAWEDKDPVVPAEYWADDGVYIDPHYPESQYEGPEEVRRVLETSLQEIIAQPRLAIENLWKDDDTFVVEVQTNHRMMDGSEVDYPQVFVIETEDGEITRWQSYLPFSRPE